MWHIPWWYISMALKVRPPQSSPIYLSIYITESTRTRLDGKHRPGKETYVFVIRIKLEKTEKERCIVRPSADIYSILRRIATVTIAVTISCPNHVHMSCHVMSCSRQGHDRLREKKNSLIGSSTPRTRTRTRRPTSKFAHTKLVLSVVFIIQLGEHLLDVGVEGARGVHHMGPFFGGEGASQ